MRRTAPTSSRESEAGFTLLEVLVGMMVLSLLGIGLWTAVTVSLRSAERFRASALANARLLQIDDRFRECMTRIRAPWWSAAPNIEAETGAWRIAFLDGDPEKTLVVAHQDGTLILDDGAYASRFPGFSSVLLESALAADGHPIGASLILEGRYIASSTIIARYGSASVRGPSSP